MPIDKPPPRATRGLFAGTFLSVDIDLRRAFPGAGKTLDNPFRFISPKVFLFGHFYFEANVPTLAFEDEKGFYIILQHGSNGATSVAHEKWR